MKALIPYLQALPDPDDLWDFLDAPFPDGFKFFAGHEAEDLPDEITDYLSFRADPPKWKDYRHRIADCILKMQLATGKIADADTRAAAVTLHSQRCGALVRLFGPGYFRDLLAVLNDDAAPWNALGFSGWKPGVDTNDGRSTSGNSALFDPSYSFRVHRRS